MQIGMIGLGRMGANMVRRLMRGGHDCVVFDRSPQASEALAKEGAVPAASLEDLVAKSQAPRVICLMLPAAVVTGTAAVVSNATASAGVSKPDFWSGFLRNQPDTNNT